MSITRNANICSPQYQGPRVLYSDKPKSSFATYKHRVRTPPKDDGIPTALLNTLQNSIRFKNPRSEPENK
ncbi:hypothetical protein ACEPAG_3641 [Sanghuangporus baumii]